MKNFKEYIKEGLFRNQNETHEERFRKDLVELLNKKIGGKLYSTTRLVRIYETGSVLIAPSHSGRKICLYQYDLEEILDDLMPLRKFPDFSLVVENSGNIEFMFNKDYKTLDFNGICCESINKLILSDVSGGEADCTIKNLNASCNIFEFDNLFDKTKPHFVFDNCKFDVFMYCMADWKNIDITSNKTVLMINGSKKKFEKFIKK